MHICIGDSNLIIFYPIVDVCFEKVFDWCFDSQPISNFQNCHFIWASTIHFGLPKSEQCQNFVSPVLEYIEFNTKQDD